MTPDPSPLAIERNAQVLTLTLDRPQKANALDAVLVDALLGQVEAAAADGTRLLVLRANGRHFCAGFDFSGAEEHSEGDLLLRFVRIEQLLQAICHAPFATLALAQGRAAGAGADLFAACSRRVASADASFVFPGAGFGIVLGTRRLASRIGAAAARQLVATAETIDAQRALAMGLATAVVEAEGWPDLVATHAALSRRLDPATQSGLHRLTTEDTRDGDMAALVASAARPGLKDRIRAYRETRRTPQAAAGSTS
jgi:enoyl-CoA hydratase/carnithine racemase